MGYVPVLPTKTIIITIIIIIIIAIIKRSKLLKDTLTLQGEFLYYVLT